MRHVGLLAAIATIGLAWAAFPSGCAARASTLAPSGTPECASRIDGFRQSVSWYRGPNRVLLEAESACAPRHGSIYDLSHVRLKIYSGKRVFAELSSDTAAWAPLQRRLLISRTDRASDRGCLRGVESLLLDLDSGELRTPGFRAILSRPRALRCAKGAA